MHRQKVTIHFIHVVYPPQTNSFSLKPKQGGKALKSVSCTDDEQLSRGVAQHAVLKLSLKLLYECSLPSQILKQAAGSLTRELNHLLA